MFLTTSAPFALLLTLCTWQAFNLPHLAPFFQDYTFAIASI